MVRANKSKGTTIQYWNGDRCQVQWERNMFSRRCLFWYCLYYWYAKIKLAPVVITQQVSISQKLEIDAHVSWQIHLIVRWVILLDPNLGWAVRIPGTVAYIQFEDAILRSIPLLFHSPSFTGQCSQSERYAAYNIICSITGRGSCSLASWNILPKCTNQSNSSWKLPPPSMRRNNHGKVRLTKS